MRYTAREVDLLKAMASNGHSGKSIARQLQRSALSVRAKACALGVRLRPIKAKREVRFVVEARLWDGLFAESKRRGVTPARLSRQIMEVLVEDRLFGAVIDDVTPRPPPRNIAPRSAPVPIAPLFPPP